MPMEKTFDAHACETAIYAAWEAVGAFKAGANASRDETFCVMIPPPNVTGSLHMGHAFNNTLQDILVRWHRMRGFDTLWQPGQDHAGIATQMVVERQLAEGEGNATRREMGRDAFLEKVWAWKEQSGGTIIDQLKRLGASCDWSRNAFTMDETFQRAVLQTFVDMYHKGLIYRGKRLVNWDPHFETAISDLEVENIEVDGNMWHFKYPLAGGETYEYIEQDEDGTVTLRETRDYISIATTRPETMLGDGAVAVHPEDQRYAPIVGKLCEIPVGPKEHRRLIPIITDSYPDPNFGSGAVKITGAHDFNDYGVAKRGNIPCFRLMDTKGALRADGAPYAQEAEKARQIRDGAEMSEAQIDAINLVPEAYRGLDRFEARKAIVADISAEGLAVMVADEEGEMTPLVERKKIMQPFGDRSKVVIEPMLTDQWFVKADVLAKPAVEAVRDGRTTILPKQDEKVYFNWLENIEPWCISRQLWWGHQIPVWYDEDGAQYCAMTEAEAQAQAGDKTLTRDEDVLDTWFSSGLWPIGTLGWPDNTPELQKYFPTNTLVTGFDIIFFWVARMMMMQLEMKGEVPFSTVYVHALVRDEKGKKMSKSLGNVLDPLDLIDQYGADAVRFTLTAMAAMGRDLKLSTDRIAGYRNFGTKLWNAARFAEMNDCFAQYDPRMSEDGLAFDQISAPANRWIVGETARVRETIDAALAAYRFNDAASAAYTHVWNRFCDWYVEFAKPLLADEATKAETQQVMAWALDQCLILLHPMMPFITEQLWGDLTKRGGMLVHGQWPTYAAADLADADADAELGWVITLIESIRSIRTELRVPAGAKIPLIQLELDAAGTGALQRNLALVERLARVPGIERAQTAPKGAVTLPVKGGVFCLPLAEHIDLEAETARLDKATQKLDKELGGLRAKLGNEKFLAGAPEAVVADQKTRLSEAEDEMEKLRAAKARLAELA